MYAFCNITSPEINHIWGEIKINTKYDLIENKNTFIWSYDTSICEMAYV